jgi:hypothetical protein
MHNQPGKNPSTDCSTSLSLLKSKVNAIYCLPRLTMTEPKADVAHISLPEALSQLSVPNINEKTPLCLPEASQETQILQPGCSQESMVSQPGCSQESVVSQPGCSQESMVSQPGCSQESIVSQPGSSHSEGSEIILQPGYSKESEIVLEPGYTAGSEIVLQPGHGQGYEYYEYYEDDPTTRYYDAAQHPRGSATEVKRNAKGKLPGNRPPLTGDQERHTKKFTTSSPTK